MTSIGASAPLDYIIESVLAPAVKVKEGYNAVSVTMLDGLVVSGVQVRETAADLVVRDALGKEQSMPKGRSKRRPTSARSCPRASSNSSSRANNRPLRLPRRTRQTRSLRRQQGQRRRVSGS